MLRPYRADQARQSLSGVLAHFFRASRMVGKGQPSLLARSRTTDCRRFKAAVARISEAPCATSSLRRSSSSGVHRWINGRISMAEEHCTDRKKGGADPNEDGCSLLGDGWRRFHDQNNRNVINRFRGRMSECCVHFSTQNVSASQDRGLTRGGTLG
jgi:hypothetical protein